MSIGVRPTLKRWIPERIIIMRIWAVQDYGWAYENLKMVMTTAAMGCYGVVR